MITSPYTTLYIHREQQLATATVNYAAIQNSKLYEQKPRQHWYWLAMFNGSHKKQASNCIAQDLALIHIWSWRRTYAWRVRLSLFYGIKNKTNSNSINTYSLHRWSLICEHHQSTTRHNQDTRTPTYNLELTRTRLPPTYNALHSNSVPTKPNLSPTYLPLSPTYLPLISH